MQTRTKVEVAVGCVLVVAVVVLAVLFADNARLAGSYRQLYNGSVADREQLEKRVAGLEEQLADQSSRIADSKQLVDQSLRGLSNALAGTGSIETGLDRLEELIRAIADETRTLRKASQKLQ